MALVQPLPMYALALRDSLEAESIANSLTVLENDKTLGIEAEITDTTREVVETNSTKTPEAIEGGPVDLDSPEEASFTSSELQRIGFVYLLTIQAFILVRMMLDPIMSRRPLLDPNLTAGGLMFLGISLFVFMMAGCTMIQPETDYTENESIKRSDTEFLCKKIDCGDENVEDWPEVLDGEPVTQERLDAAVEKMKGVSSVLYCMFMPEECKQD